MPIYAYKCDSCGFAKDVLQKISDPQLAECPSCHAGAFRKQVTAAGFQLKGSGWYVTDFRGGNGAAAQKSGDKSPETGSGTSETGGGTSDTGAGKSDAGGQAKSSDTPQTKTESKTESKPAAEPAAKRASTTTPSGSGSGS